MMSKRLGPFAKGIDQLEAKGPSPELDQTLASSVAHARIFMFAAWVALALAAGLGLVQPGSANVVAVEPLKMESPE